MSEKEIKALNEEELEQVNGGANGNGLTFSSEKGKYSLKEGASYYFVFKEYYMFGHTTHYCYGKCVWTGEKVDDPWLHTTRRMHKVEVWHGYCAGKTIEIFGDHCRVYRNGPSYDKLPTD